MSAIYMAPPKSKKPLLSTNSYYYSWWRFSRHYILLFAHITKIIGRRCVLPVIVIYTPGKNITLLGMPAIRKVARECSCQFATLCALLLVRLYYTHQLSVTTRRGHHITCAMLTYATAPLRIERRQAAEQPARSTPRHYYIVAQSFRMW